MSEPAPFAQEYLDRGGERVGLQIYPWPNDPAAPIAVIWPAMGVPARYYRRFAAALTAAGIGVVVADLRGTGASTPPPSRASRYGYAELADDVGAVLARPSLSGRRVFLVGHSLGGQACIMHAALEPDRPVAGIVLVAVGLPYFRSYGRRAAGVYTYTQAIAATAAALGIWPGWGFGGRQARGVIRDWGFTARHGRFPRLHGRDVNAGLAGIRTPVLAVSVDDDRYTPAGTVDHLAAMLRGAPVERVHYSTAEAGAGVDHFLWVRASDALVARIARFMSPPDEATRHDPVSENFDPAPGRLQP